MAEIQKKIEEDRKLLESKKDMAEEERNKVAGDLDKKETELKKYQYVNIDFDEFVFILINCDVTSCLAFRKVRR